LHRFHDSITYFPNLARSRDSEHIILEVILIMHALVLLCINQYTRFEVPSFTNYKDIIGVNLKNGSRDPDHAPLRVICHPYAKTR